MFYHLYFVKKAILFIMRTPWQVSFDCSDIYWYPGNFLDMKKKIEMKVWGQQLDIFTSKERQKKAYFPECKYMSSQGLQACSCVLMSEYMVQMERE